MSPRIVSLVPSGTETLLSLGAPVMACTRFCEQPGIPHVGGTKNPDIAAIIELDPDFVVMDREENRREDADALAEAGIELFVSDVTTVDAAERFVVDLAARVGLAAPVAAGRGGGRGDDDPRDCVRADLASSVDVDQPSDVRRRPPRPASASRWSPMMNPTAIPTVDLDDVVARRPDVVLVPSEPYEFRDGHLDELRDAFGAAVPVVRVDGRDLFWWGSRTPGAVSRLRAQLDPLIP